MHIGNYFSLSECPMNSEEFNLKIEYIDDTILNTNFIGINIKYFENNNNLKSDDNKNFEYL